MADCLQGTGAFKTGYNLAIEGIPRVEPILSIPHPESINPFSNPEKPQKTSPAATGRSVALRKRRAHLDREMLRHIPVEYGYENTLGLSGLSASGMSGPSGGQGELLCFRPIRLTYSRRVIDCNVTVFGSTCRVGCLSVPFSSGHRLQQT